MDTDGQVLHYSTLRVMRCRIAELEARNAELVAALSALVAGVETFAPEYAADIGWNGAVIEARAALAKAGEL